MYDRCTLVMFCMTYSRHCELHIPNNAHLVNSTCLLAILAEDPKDTVCVHNGEVACVNGTEVKIISNQLFGYLKRTEMTFDSLEGN